VTERGERAGGRSGATGPADRTGGTGPAEERHAGHDSQPGNNPGPERGGRRADRMPRAAQGRPEPADQRDPASPASPASPAAARTGGSRRRGPRHGPRSAARARWSRGGLVTLITVAAMVAGLGVTLFGLGTTNHALATANPSAWLWSSGRGEVARVNGETGRVDTRYKVVDAQGHVIQISQTDRYLVLRDLSTGQVSSLNLATLQIAATTRTTAGLGITIALSGDSAFVVDTVQGVVQQLDPLSLTPVGAPLRFPPGLSGGTFDNAGTLWLAVPGEGTVVAIRPAGTARPAGARSGGAAPPAGGGPTVVRSAVVAEPGHDLSLSTLDTGVAVLDGTAGTLSTVGTGSTRTVSLPLHGPASVPGRSPGGSVPVTATDDRHVYVVHGNQVTGFTVPGTGAKLAPAVPFAGRLYVADNATGTVYVLDAGGRRISTIEVPTRGAPLDLDVRGDHLFINAPDGSSARVVDLSNNVKSVNKYANNVLGGDPPANPPPPPPPARPPVGPPGAPTRVTAVAGNASAHITWGPAAPHGFAVVRYVVEGDGRSHQVGARQRSLDVAGLTNGQQYRFTVYAVNAKGAGPRRAANPVVPTAAVPDPPARVTGTEAPDGTVVVSWTAGNGQGRRIPRYQVTSVPPGPGVSVWQARGTRLVVPAGALTYGTQYAFTVVSINDRGASSTASAPSNTVVPYTRPDAPGDLRASTVDAKGTVAVTWNAAPDNGRPVTGYAVSAGGAAAQTVTGTSVTLTGLGDGATVKVTVKAVNKAGAGPAASASARTIDKPAVTAGTPARPTYRSVSVPFTVNPNGGRTTCTIAVNGGAAKGIACTGGTVSGWPGTRYAYTVTATNKAGSASFTGSQTTPVLYSTTVCADAGYCGPGAPRGGIWVYTTPDQNGTPVGDTFNGQRYQATCWATGPATVDATPWGGKKDSRWVRINFKGSNYIPYAWVRLDGGDSLANLPHC
jgi:Fibronectin type III domain